MKVKFKPRRPDRTQMMSREIIQDSESTKPKMEIVCSRRRDRMQQFLQRMRLPRWSSKNSDSEAETVVESPDEPELKMPDQKVENDAAGPTALMDFPAEVLHEIWRFCWEPRIVEVQPYTNDEIQDKAELFSSDTYCSSAKPPVTLFICRQSRIDTLRFYKLSFAAYMQEPQVYFNFKIDELYVKHVELARFQQFFTMFPHEDLSKIQHLRVSENIMQRIFNASACYNHQEQPGWTRKEPMTGILGLETLVVQRELSLVSPVQTRDACFWDMMFFTDRCRHRNTPWEKVFEYLGEGAWPIVSIEGHQGALLYPEIGWSYPMFLYEYCCRPDPIGTLNSLRKLQKSYFLYLEKLTCRCLLSSAMRWAEVAGLRDPETRRLCYSEYCNLYDKFIGYTTPIVKPDRSRPPNSYKEGSDNRTRGLKRQYMAWIRRRDVEKLAMWTARSTARM